MCDYTQNHHIYLNCVNKVFVAKLYTQPSHFFRSGEYLIGDLAYTASSTMVPPFKRPRGLLLSKVKQEFNYALSNERVAIEHTIGILKMRWQSLQSCRLQITGWASAA